MKLFVFSKNVIDYHFVHYSYEYIDATNDESTYHGLSVFPFDACVTALALPFNLKLCSTITF